VSNSSSSSFICDICGHEASGWDMCLSEAYMVECVNGHVFCEDHLDKEKFEKMIEDDDGGDFRYEIPKDMCPICLFEHILDSDAVKFLLGKCNISMDALKKDIKDTFEDYDEFVEQIGNKR